MYTSLTMVYLIKSDFLKMIIKESLTAALYWITGYTYMKTLNLKHLKTNVIPERCGAVQQQQKRAED